MPTKVNTEETPTPAIYLDRALTRDGTKISSRVHLDQLHKVLAARAGAGLITGGIRQAA